MTLTLVLLTHSGTPREVLWSVRKPQYSPMLALPLNRPETLSTPSE